MLVAAAVCPHPPLLVPELGTGAEPELDRLRASCGEAVDALLAERSDELVVVGADPGGGTYEATAGASMQPYGVDHRLGGPDGELPLALAIGAWLLDRAGRPRPARYAGIAPDAPTTTCLALGGALASSAERVALLVLADGSARRTARSPGRHDERGEPFDALVTAALDTGDRAALAALDPALATELMVDGRAACQVLAGAADQPSGPDSAIDAHVRYAAAPYGVGYVVATWRMITLIRGTPAARGL